MTRTNKKNLLPVKNRGFTMVEITAALLILSMVLSTVMFLMNRYLDAVVDMRLRQRSFEVARANMETLLAADKLEDLAEFGESERYPDIYWETTVEPFTLPVKDRMWVRAVCSASYTDTKGERQEVELEHWITSLTGDQIKKIMNQQEALGEYYDLIKEGFMTVAQMATAAFLEQEKMPVTEYREIVEDHRREKLEYLQVNTDKFSQPAFDKVVDQLDEEENEFLEEIGMDFDKYNEFALTYEPPVQANDSSVFAPGDWNNATSAGQQDYGDETSDASQQDQQEEYQWDWENIDKSLWPLIEHLTGAKPPYS